MDEVVQRFADLFSGRTDAWGTEEGGCARPMDMEVPYGGHLTGTARPIGIYPVVGSPDDAFSPRFFVKWGACDIDYDDIQEAINFHDLLAQVGIPSYIERSRSKGYHVWVFVENWISAETMRHALLVVRDFLKMQAREIYPKQTTLKEGELGNYLRLPYPGALTEAPWNPLREAAEGAPLRRRVMIVDGSIDWYELTLEKFLDRVQYADPWALEKLASRYQPPAASEVRWQRENFDDEKHDHIARQALTRIDAALAWHIYTNGPMAGGDRSSTLMRLCNMVMDKGATIEEAFSIIWSADSKDWGGKYVNRYDGEQRVMELVERVYGHKGPPDSS